ncbi:hypothetical protein [Cryobacterium sp. Y57]|nr:hypothetical protein [Cryobacterium sp. Y57]
MRVLHAAPAAGGAWATMDRRLASVARRLGLTVIDRESNEVT